MKSSLLAIMCCLWNMLPAGSLTAAERTGTSQPRMLQEAGAFRMAADDGQAAVRKLGMEVRDGVAAVPFPESRAVTGVAVSGKIIRHDPDYIVRILLRDRQGGEHLILESYEEICDGDTVLFSDYCEETALMDGIDADSVKVVARGATVQLDRLRYGRAAVSEATLRKSAARTAAALRDTLRRQQVQRIADRINEYNRAHKKLWRAGVTGVALQPYEVRKRTVGFSDEVSSLGLEYYAGGIFQFGSHRKDAREDGHAALKSVTATAGTSPFPESFDWRNRHGRNWITPHRSQGFSGYCTAFGALGCVEALANLYLNKKKDIDLSEQNLAVCAYNEDGDPYIDGYANPFRVLDYMKVYGVYDEQTNPYEELRDRLCIRDHINPYYAVSIQDYTVMKDQEANYMEYDSVKYHLIHHGPLYAGFYNNASPANSHAMALIGYQTVHAGDTVSFYNNQEGWHVIAENDMKDPCWIFKNSWYDSPDYFYAIFENSNTAVGKSMLGPAYIELSTSTLMQELNDTVVWEDRDGDGYYFWGLGPKPANCPSYVPDEPDGDDSNPHYGPMTAYGRLLSFNPDENDTLYISGSMNASPPYNIYETLPRKIFHHTVVEPGVTWHINTNVSFVNGAKLIVKPGATLAVSGSSYTPSFTASLENVILIVEPNATLDISEYGRVILNESSNPSMSVQDGSTLVIYSLKSIIK